MIDGMRVENIEKMEELMPLIVESLQSGQSIRFSPRGVSMLPMIRQGIDTVVISPVVEKLRKYDIPLYKRDDGKYVLHRVVGVSNTYTCIGDNQFVRESGIRHDQLVAVVTAFYRGEKACSVKHPLYRIYCHLWHWTRPMRHFLRRAKRWIRRQLL